MKLLTFEHTRNAAPPRQASANPSLDRLVAKFAQLLDERPEAAEFVETLIDDLLDDEKGGA